MDKNKKNFNRIQRNAYTPEHVESWQKNGLSKTEYGRQNGIHPNALSRWIKRHAHEPEDAGIAIGSFAVAASAKIFI